MGSRVCLGRARRFEGERVYLRLLTPALRAGRFFPFLVTLRLDFFPLLAFRLTFLDFFPFLDFFAFLDFFPFFAFFPFFPFLAFFLPFFLGAFFLGAAGEATLAGAAASGAAAGAAPSSTILILKSLLLLVILFDPTKRVRALLMLRLLPLLRAFWPAMYFLILSADEPCTSPRLATASITNRW